MFEFEEYPLNSLITGAEDLRSIVPRPPAQFLWCYKYSWATLPSQLVAFRRVLGVSVAPFSIAFLTNGVIFQITFYLFTPDSSEIGFNFSFYIS